MTSSSPATIPALILPVIAQYPVNRHANINATPAKVIVVNHASEHYQKWYQEGCQRTAANSRFQRKHSPEHQHVPGQALTVDQMGRICEGPIELLLGLDVAAVLQDRTDKRPDVVVDGIRFDVKGSVPRYENSFAVECEKVRSGGTTRCCWCSS